MSSNGSMKLLLATSNPHKVDEVRAILAQCGIDVLGLEALPTLPPEPEETGATFEDNARIKAIAYAQASGRVCLADDSGLEVDALGGAPGVHSARYANPGYDESRRRKTEITRADRDAANNAKLLRELGNVPFEERTARFVCAMCLADPTGEILAETRGTFDGLITDHPAGTNGFGYDPLLYLPDRRCTSAELSLQEKNARSHRGQAARMMAAHIKSMSILNP